MESRTLMLSVAASAGFGVLALVWGLLSGSQLIVFDGLYSFAAVGLSLLAVLALRTSRRGPDERYPWGREVWEPLAVVVKATALAGLCLYALVEAVARILAGPEPVETGAAVVYGALSTVAGLVVTIVLRRRARGGSDLVRAEAAEWAGDTLLSLGVLVGFCVALVLEATGHADLARYVDPVMVILVSAAFLPVPARLAATGFREILTMSPAPELRQRIRDAAEATRAREGFAEVFVRAGKVGGRLDVEIDYVVGGADPTVRACDEVRAALEEELRPLATPGALSLSVGFTADRDRVT
ncbi:cation transporter [Pseudonocardia ailaonensis]|uniref:Cation transporter n=1 Tax=Pseudonocardia ailaonensis TaxID=367279 RepID=A0ABN2N4T6_9PSEU